MVFEYADFIVIVYVLSTCTLMVSCYYMPVCLPIVFDKAILCSQIVIQE